MSKSISASSSSSECSEDCSTFVEREPFELPTKFWVFDAVEDDE